MVSVRVGTGRSLVGTGRLKAEAPDLHNIYIDIKMMMMIVIILLLLLWRTFSGHSVTNGNPLMVTSGQNNL